MSIFLCKSILSRRNLAKTIINPNVFHNTLRWLSNEPNQHSFTVSYLINSLGLSLEASESIAKCVSFKTRTKPDKAIEFLRNFGFTQTQISRLVRSFPQILSLNTERIILPKLEFFESKGISRPELTKTLSTYPSLLRSSLDKRIKPTFEYLMTILPSEAKIVTAMKRWPNLFSHNFKKFVLPNVSTLRSHGVPDSNIAKFLHSWPQSLSMIPVPFREAVEEVAEMGFSPSKVSFLVAVCAKVYKSKWESKVILYKKFGWSENDILRAFLTYPWCMIASEDKITLVMDFFVSELGLKPTELAIYPMVFTFSLNKRIVPRVRVFRALVSKGLLKTDQCSIYSLLKPLEKLFLQRYVTRYENVAPELLKIYKGEKIGCFERTIENWRNLG